MAKKKQDPQQRAIAAMTRELDTINAQMKEAYAQFNNTCEEELIDACIYEIAALQARYSYLLRCIKELSGGPKRQQWVVRYTAVQEFPQEHCAAATAMKGGPLCRA